MKICGKIICLQLLYELVILCDLENNQAKIELIAKILNVIRSSYKCLTWLCLFPEETKFIWFLF